MTTNIGLQKPCIVISNRQPTLTGVEIVAENDVRINRYYGKNRTEVIVGIDTEDNGLDPFLNQVLLIGIEYNDCRVIIDCNSVEEPLNYVPFNALWIAHHAKFDYKMIASLGYKHRNWFCTMTAEQKLYQGALYSNENLDGIKVGLANVVAKYCDYYITAEDKDVRNEFVGVGFSQYKIKQTHVDYLINDIRFLLEVREKQVIEIEKYNLVYYFQRIAPKLIWVVGDIEMEGFHLHKDKWLDIEKRNKERLKDTEIELDNELRKIRDMYLTKDERLYLVGGKYDRVRREITKTQYNLFGDAPTVTVSANPNAYINWGSSKQVIEIYGRLKCQLPVKKDNEVSYRIPTFKKKKLKTGTTEVVDSEYYSYTTGAPDLEAMMIDEPNNIANTLTALLIQYRQITKAIDTYGSSFLSKINSATGKIHTAFRTDSAVTGRFQSGGGKADSDKVNFQNIPRDIEMRECFHAGEDYMVITADLSGAEVTIMCDKANDRRLYEWAVINDDAHSPIAQATWRDIYLYRAAKLAGIVNTPNEFWKAYELLPTILHHSTGDVKEMYELATTLEINKSSNKAMRTQFKPMTFGTVYQMKGKKAGKTLNIAQDEGEVGIDSIKRAIPDTFAYVDTQIGKAINDGYLIINPITNSRTWFPDIIKAYKVNQKPSWKVIANVSGKAANLPFQGTQADMIKEALIDIAEWIITHQLDAAILSTVHDEIVVKYHKKYIGQTFAFKNQELTILEIVKELMIDAANKYLFNFKMKCDAEEKESWTK